MNLSKKKGFKCNMNAEQRFLGKENLNCIQIHQKFKSGNNKSIIVSKMMKTALQ